MLNDRADVARIAGADGVYVGQEDLSPEAVRWIVGPAAIVGLSSGYGGADRPRRS